MEVRLLGALEADDDAGQPIRLTGAKLRALLTLLALSPGEVVPVDLLADRLWGDSPPADVANALQVLVSKLRRAVGGSDRITRSGPGYALSVTPDDVDALRFEHLARNGRDATERRDPAAAVDLFEAALALWRGEPLVDVAYEEFGRLEATRLEELRLALEEDRADAQLALGRHAAAVGVLEPMVADHPLRERARCLLMLGLYRAGRQADALRVFQEGRTLLGEELGLEPGPELRRLEAAILAQDPSLDAPQPEAVPSSPPTRRALPVTNLQAPLTDLIGRADDVAGVGARLADQRLVTIAGPGGAGKTRLAVEVAWARRDDRTDGSWFVDLSPAVDNAGVVAAMVAALGVTELGDQPAIDRVTAFVAAKDLLLVLDNAEQAVDAVADVVALLLSKSPELHVLVTSREALRVPGEVLWTLGPLDPDDASALFLERARAADATLDLGGADEQALVHDICGRLDRLPLAIELAAARARAFPLGQIASRLDDRFRLLTSGARTALPHQQTMRAVIDWSYDLLFDQEQQVLRRLSVFVGGFTLEMAEVVCATGDLPSEEVGDLMARLIDKSLVQVDRSGGGLRYRLLQTLADYGHERLDDSGEVEATRDRLLLWAVGLSKQGRAAWMGDEQPNWIGTVRSEVDNLRAAFDWAVDQGDAASAVAIAGNVGWFWWPTGRAGEGVAWIVRALALEPARGGPVNDIDRATALTWRAYLGFHTAVETEDLDAIAYEGAELARSAGDLQGFGANKLFHGQVAFLRGDIDLARDLFAEAQEAYAMLPPGAWSTAAATFVDVERAMIDGDLERGAELLASAIALLDESGDLWSRSLSEYSLAEVCARLGRMEEAVAAIESALEVARTLALPGFEATLLARLGLTAFAAGDVDLARVRFDEALAMSRRLAYPPSLAMALAGAANLSRADGRAEEAEERATEAARMYSPSSGVAALPSGAAMCLTTLGWLAFDREDLDAALDLHRRALREAIRSRHEVVLAGAAEGMAGVLARAGDAEAAAMLLGAALTIRRHGGGRRTPLDDRDAARTEEAATKALGEEALKDAMERGGSEDPIELFQRYTTL